MSANKDYKGIKINDEIIIVENTGGQGYVVDKGNDAMLETAKLWASDTIKVDDKWVKSVPKIYEYKNGKFKLKLKEAAGNSCQSGKLSFWNCVITAPDGKEFIIGINSSLLLNTLLENNFNNGECDKDIWLGRVGGQQAGTFTENMEDFKQAKADAELREKVKKSNTNYEVGDEICTLTTKNIYGGTVYKYFEYKDFNDYHKKKYKILIYKTPKKVHLYFSEKLEISYWYSNFLDKKMKRMKTGNKFNIDVEGIFIEKKRKRISEDLYSVDNMLDTLMYGIDPRPINKEDLKEDINNIRRDYKSKGEKAYYRDWVNYPLLEDFEMED